jgi:hypothetical protein
VIALRFAPERIKGVVSDIIATNKIKAELIRNQPMPPLFQGWKSKQRKDVDRDRGRER